MLNKQPHFQPFSTNQNNQLDNYIMAKTLKIIETKDKTELYELINSNWILIEKLEGEYKTVIIESNY